MRSTRRLRPLPQKASACSVKQQFQSTSLQTGFFLILNYEVDSPTYVISNFMDILDGGLNSAVLVCTSRYISSSVTASFSLSISRSTACQQNPENYSRNGNNHQSGSEFQHDLCVPNIPSRKLRYHKENRT